MRRKPRYFRIFILTVILFSILYLVFSLAFNNKDRWVSLKESFVSVSTEHRAIIITEEVIYKSLNTGFLEKAEEEGKKVKKGQILASLVSTLDFADEIKEVKGQDEGGIIEEENIQEEAEGEENADEEAQADADKQEKTEDKAENKDNKEKSKSNSAIEQDATLTFNKLNQAIKDGETSKVLSLKRELNYKLDTLKKSSESQNNSNIENERFIGSAMAKAADKFSIISNEPGTLSYIIDDYSGKLNYDMRYDYDYEELFNGDIHSKNMKSAEFKRLEPVFKIVSPSKWHLICEVKIDDIENFRNSEKISIRIDGDEIKGEVIDKYIIGNFALAAIEIREPLNLMTSTRRTNVTIVHEKIAAVVVPYDALSSEGSVQGVYVKGINGERVFRPIDIKHSNEDGYVVTSGSFTVKDRDGGIKTVDTVTNGDSVLIRQTH